MENKRKMSGFCSLDRKGRAGRRLSSTSGPLEAFCRVRCFAIIAQDIAFESRWNAQDVPSTRALRNFRPGQPFKTVADVTSHSSADVLCWQNVRGETEKQIRRAPVLSCRHRARIVIKTQLFSLSNNNILLPVSGLEVTRNLQ